MYQIICVDVAESFCYIFFPVQPSYTCYQNAGKLLNAWRIKWCTCVTYIVLGFVNSVLLIWLMNFHCILVVFHQTLQ